MNRTDPGRRWLRTASVVLPVIAIGIVVFSLIASTSGGAPTPVPADASRALASLLTGAPVPDKHRLTGKHRRRLEQRHTVLQHQTSGAQTARGNAVTAPSRNVYRAPAVAYPRASAHDISMAPATQVIASLAHATNGYPGPNALMADQQVPASWYGHQSALPVISTSRERLLVRLAQRPNGATTWINRSKAELLITHWAIVIDLSRHFLYVFYNGVQQYAFPVGTGAPGTPTPTGQFFVAFHSLSNGPGYGPINIATSAHSTVFRSFDGGDDAIIGIHGPVGSDAEIGDHGAAISNGCIRMHLPDLAKVVGHVPDGAPVVVTY